MENEHSPPKSYIPCGTSEVFSNQKEKCHLNAWEKAKQIEGPFQRASIKQTGSSSIFQRASKPVTSQPTVPDILQKSSSIFTESKPEILQPVSQIPQQSEASTSKSVERQAGTDIPLNRDSKHLSFFQQASKPVVPDHALPSVHKESSNFQQASEPESPQSISQIHEESEGRSSNSGERNVGVNIPTNKDSTPTVPIVKKVPTFGVPRAKIFRPTVSGNTSNSLASAAVQTSTKTTGSSGLARPSFNHSSNSSFKYVSSNKNIPNVSESVALDQHTTNESQCEMTATSNEKPYCNTSTSQNKIIPVKPNFGKKTVSGTQPLLKNKPGKRERSPILSHRTGSKETCSSGPKHVQKKSKPGKTELGKRPLPKVTKKTSHNPREDDEFNSLAKVKEEIDIIQYDSDSGVHINDFAQDHCNDREQTISVLNKDSCTELDTVGVPSTNVKKRPAFKAEKFQPRSKQSNCSTDNTKENVHISSEKISSAKTKGSKAVPRSTTIKTSKSAPSSSMTNADWEYLFTTVIGAAAKEEENSSNTGSKIQQKQTTSSSIKNKDNESGQCDSSSSSFIDVDGSESCAEIIPAEDISISSLTSQPREIYFLKVEEEGEGSSTVDKPTPINNVIQEKEVLSSQHLKSLSKVIVKHPISSAVVKTIITESHSVSQELHKKTREPLKKSLSTNKKVNSKRQLPDDESSSELSSSESEVSQEEESETSPHSTSIKEQVVEMMEKVDEILWVQCDDCMKWRKLSHILDPSTLPKIWTCKKIPIKGKNNCQEPEEEWRQFNEAYIYNQYVMGSVVWARVPGSEWWPAMVDIDPDYKKYIWLNETATAPNQYHVTFFGEPVTRSWVSPKNMKSFEMNDTFRRFWLGPQKEQQKIPLLKVAVKTAHQALSMDVRSRRKTFAFVVRFTGKLTPKRSIECSQNNHKSSEVKKRKVSLSNKKQIASLSSVCTNHLPDIIPTGEYDSSRKKKTSTPVKKPLPSKRHWNTNIFNTRNISTLEEGSDKYCDKREERQKGDAVCSQQVEFVQRRDKRDEQKSASKGEKGEYEEQYNNGDNEPSNQDDEYQIQHDNGGNNEEPSNEDDEHRNVNSDNAEICNKETSNDSGSKELRNEDGDNEEPSNEDGDNEEPSNEDGNNEEPSNEDGDNVKPSNKDGDNEEPSNEDGDNVKPSNEDGDNEEPRNEDGDNVKPSNEDGDNEEPCNEDGDNEEPSNEDGDNEEPCNEDGDNEKPSNEDGDDEEPTNEDGDNEEPSNEDGDNEEPSNEDGGNEEPSNEDGDNEEPSNEDGDNEEPSNEDGDNEEPSNEDNDNKEPRNEDGDYEEPSNEDGDNEEPSNEDGDYEEPSNEDGDNEEPSNEDGDNLEPSNEDDDNEEPSNEDGDNEEPSNEGDNEEPSNEDGDNKEPSNEDGDNEEPSNEDGDNEEPSNEDGDNEDGDNEDSDNEEPSNEDGDNEEPSNEDGDNEEPSNEDGDNEEPSNEDGDNEPSNEDGNNEEPSNEDGDNEEPSNEDGDNEEPSNEDGDNKEPSNEDGDNEEPSNEDGDNEEPSNEDGDNEEPSNEDGDNEEPSNEDGDYEEPSNEDGDNEEPSNEDGDNGDNEGGDNEGSDNEEPSNEDGNIDDGTNEDGDNEQSNKDGNYEDSDNEDGDNEGSDIEDGDNEGSDIDDGDNEGSDIDDGDNEECSNEDCVIDDGDNEDDDNEELGNEDGDNKKSNFEEPSNEDDCEELSNEDGDNEEPSNEDGYNEELGNEDCDYEAPKNKDYYEESNNEIGNNEFSNGDGDIIEPNSNDESSNKDGDHEEQGDNVYEEHVDNSFERKEKCDNSWEYKKQGNNDDEYEDQCKCVDNEHGDYDSECERHYHKDREYEVKCSSVCREEDERGNVELSKFVFECGRRSGDGEQDDKEVDLEEQGDYVIKRGKEDSNKWNLKRLSNNEESDESEDGDEKPDCKCNVSFYDADGEDENNDSEYENHGNSEDEYSWYNVKGRKTISQEHNDLYVPEACSHKKQGSLQSHSQGSLQSHSQGSLQIHSQLSIYKEYAVKKKPGKIDKQDNDISTESKIIKKMHHNFKEVAGKRKYKNYASLKSDKFFKSGGYINNKGLISTTKHEEQVDQAMYDFVPESQPDQQDVLYNGYLYALGVPACVSPKDNPRLPRSPKAVQTIRGYTSPAFTYRTNSPTNDTESPRYLVKCSDGDISFTSTSSFFEEETSKVDLRNYQLCQEPGISWKIDKEEKESVSSSSSGQGDTSQEIPLRYDHLRINC